VQVSVGAEDSIGAAWGGAPAEVRVVLHKAAGDEQLVLPANLWFSQKLQDCGLIHHDGAVGGRALDALAAALTHHHDPQVGVPALLAEVVATLQPTHGLKGICQHAYVADELLSWEGSSTAGSRGLGPDLQAGVWLRGLPLRRNDVGLTEQRLLVSRIVPGREGSHLTTSPPSDPD
jgi:hypothetical protein